jgi:uroporphyrinogen decarboxylase
MMDQPELLERWHAKHLAYVERQTAALLEYEFDYLLLGGSGTLTLASPKLVEQFALPGIQRLSAMAKQKGVPIMLHSCGFSRLLVDMLAERTDVDCVNPLEVRPMGDVDLAEVKLARGDQIALMGNLPTTDVMLRGTADDVRSASLQAMADAGTGGGFILSTGDQVARDTPDENIFAMMQAAKAYGVYDSFGQLPRLKDRTITRGKDEPIEV